MKQTVALWISTLVWVSFALAIAPSGHAQQAEWVYNLAPLSRVVGWVDYDCGNGKDTWRIEVPHAGQLVVSLIGMDWDEDIDLALFDSGGEILDFSRNVGSEWEYVGCSVPSEGGAYHVQVRAGGSGDAGGYVLRSFATPPISILLYQGQEEGITFPELALKVLGFEDYSEVTDLNSFIHSLEGEKWDLVIIYNVDVDSHLYVESILGHLEQGGACIISDYALEEDTLLLEGLDATWLCSVSSLPTISFTPTTSLFTNPNLLPNLEASVFASMFASASGDVLQVGDSAHAAATLEWEPGLDAIIISHDGRAILNAFDMELLEDEVEAVATLVNELSYVLLAENWGKASQADWWYRDPVSRAKKLVEEAKFVAAISEFRTALDRLTPPYPPVASRSYISEDFIPGSGESISNYRDEVETINHLLACVADLVEITTVFFNQVAITDGFKDFENRVSRRMEVATQWVRDLLMELDRAKDTGLGLYPLPPTSVYTSLYPAYDVVNGLSLCSIEVVNHSEQTKSVTISASVPSLTTEEIVEVTLPPRSNRTVDLSPALLPETMDLAAPRLGVLELKAGQRKYGPYPIEFLPGEWPIHPDFYPFLIAWITPDDPSVIDFVHTALESLPAEEGEEIIGIQNRAEALWEALHDYGFGYLDALPAYVSWSQKVRLPSQALEEDGGNCLEGSLLVASLLEAAGISPFVLIVPAEQHSMVGWETFTGKYEFVETTFLDSILVPFDLASLWGTNTWEFDYRKGHVIWLVTLSLEHEVDREAVYVLDVAALRKAWDVAISD